MSGQPEYRHPLRVTSAEVELEATGGAEGPDDVTRVASTGIKAANQGRFY